MPESIRLFIAIELTEELKAVLTEIGRELEARIPPRTVRWVKPAAMHLTLVFLGETPVSQLEAVKAAVSTAVAGLPQTSFGAVGLGCFPNPRRPRVIWVGVDEAAGNLPRIKEALDRELEPLGFKPERQPFSPHLTLGRVDKRAGNHEAAELGRVLERATLQEIGRVEATQIHLIRSDLRPTGPVYTIVASFPLAKEHKAAGAARKEL
jgi:2'-5' RNA ligase